MLCQSYEVGNGNRYRRIKKTLEKSKWYSENGEKKVGELYEEMHSRVENEEDPKGYCDNIREACKNIEKAFSDISPLTWFRKKNEELRERRLSFKS